MAIARTSKRLNLRTEASARFERGCDPAGIDRAAVRFCELLALTGGPDLTLADGVLDVVGDVPVPLEIAVRPSRVNGLLGTDLSAGAIADLLIPLGMGAMPTGGDDDPVDVVVPTFRPDIRPAPIGEADLAEEVARIYGYARLPRRQPAWPQPGGLTAYQRERRYVKDVLCGIGASEAWTAAFVTEDDQLAAGFAPPYVEITNPLVDAERFLRSSMAPGLVRAVLYNAERRQGDVRLFEVGSVFRIADVPDETGRRPTRASACAPSSPATATTPGRPWPPGARWPTPCVWPDWEMEQGPRGGGGPRVTHELPFGRAGLAAGRRAVDAGWSSARWGSSTRPSSRRSVWSAPTAAPAGWAGSTSISSALLDPAVARRRPLEAAAGQPLSLVRHRPGLRGARGGAGRQRRGHAVRRPGATCSSRCVLFDVYRGDGAGRRDPQPRLPPAVLRPRPDADRRGDRHPAVAPHHSGRTGPPGHPALNLDRRTWHRTAPVDPSLTTTPSAPVRRGHITLGSTRIQATAPTTPVMPWPPRLP